MYVEGLEDFTKFAASLIFLLLEISVCASLTVLHRFTDAKYDQLTWRKLCRLRWKGGRGMNDARKVLSFHIQETSQNRWCVIFCRKFVA